jgi:hypothetical protein
MTSPVDDSFVSLRKSIASVHSTSKIVVLSDTLQTINAQEGFRLWVDSDHNNSIVVGETSGHLRDDSIKNRIVRTDAMKTLWLVYLWRVSPSSRFCLYKGVHLARPIALWLLVAVSTFSRSILMNFPLFTIDPHVFSHS